MKTKPCHYYGRTWDGRLIEALPSDPDAVICRRVADYPGGQPPAAATLTACRDCEALVAFNPTGPYLDRPRVCLQCAGIQPLPMDS